MDAARELFEKIAQDNEVLRVFTNHSLRVMYFSMEVARKMGCCDRDLEVAALLHDIGKIGLAKEILFKPGKLNSLEYTIIKAHSHIGNTIIRNELGLHRAASFVRDHHERWDGRGYPRGISGEEISIQGRIISICDAFDTMTIDRRTYKQKTLTYDEAYLELQENAYTQFDGRIVDLFISVVSDMKLPPTEEWSNRPCVMEKIFVNC